MKSKKLRRMVLRAALISTLVCTININIIANKGTFSMFTSSAEGYATIKTADTGDIIKSFNIVEEYGQQFIVIEPGEFLKDDSIVYFEVTGEAAPYIMHINPIALSKDKTPMNSNYMQWHRRSTELRISKNQQYFISDDEKLYIPIYVDVNFWQKPSVLSNKDYKGNITLRYLNGFITETKQVDLSSDYLNSRWHCGTDYYFWENVKISLSSSNISSKKSGGHSIMASKIDDSLEELSENSFAMNEFENEFNNEFQNQFKKLFNGTLDNEQIEIINSIAYGYREYVSSLETKNQELLKQLEDLQKEKQELINQIEALKNENVQLSEELSSQIEALKAENEHLQATIDELREFINSATTVTPNPPVDNGTGNGGTAGGSDGTGSGGTDTVGSDGTGSGGIDTGGSDGTGSGGIDTGGSDGTGSGGADTGGSDGTGSGGTDTGGGNGTGNEGTNTGGGNDGTENPPPGNDSDLIGYQYNYTILRGLNEINNTNNTQMTLSLIQNNFNDA